MYLCFHIILFNSQIIHLLIIIILIVPQPSCLNLKYILHTLILYDSKLFFHILVKQKFTLHL